jgi:tRNA A37 methylthiotransferase MiaB
MNQIKEIKSAFVISNGCHECFLDAALVQRYLREKHGLLLADDIAAADVIILLGCAVMQPKEEQSRELIRIACERKKENSQLIVSGCVAKVRPEVAAQFNQSYDSLATEIGNLIGLRGEYKTYQANFPYQPYRGHKKDLLGSVANHVRQKSLKAATENNGNFYSWLVRYFSKPIISALSQYKDFIESKIDVWDTETYTIKISTGCRGNCSYCSIKKARGSIRSKPIENVLEEFKIGLQKGYSSFALIGTDIGDYGKDQGKDLLDLLKILVQRPEKFQLRLRNVNPRWIIRVGSEFHSLLRSGKIKYMESPIQSASNRILQLMRRGYRAEDFLDTIRQIKSVCPSLFIKTQVIVGFPSETDEDFRKQLDLFRTRNFDYIDVFRYSDRPDAAASSIPGKIPQDLAMKRYRKLFFKSLIHLDYRPIFHEMFSHRRLVK